MADPSNLHAIDDIKFTTGYNVEPVVSSEASITEAIERYYAQETNISYDEIMEGFDEEEIDFAEDDLDGESIDLERLSADAPVIRLCNAILLSAIKKGASDIHCEPYEKVLRETVSKWGAEDGTAIVLDPSTGEVLAMAQTPGYDANNTSSVAHSSAALLRKQP